MGVACQTEMFRKNMKLFLKQQILEASKLKESADNNFDWLYGCIRV